MDFKTAQAAKCKMPSELEALPGRSEAISPAAQHHTLGTSILPPYPKSTSSILLGMGCFWGAERAFWTLDGVYTTAVGYAGGFTPNPSYEEVCAGKTGHTEVVRVVYSEDKIELADILSVFWERHDPTQGMRQGNDVGTQYRSFIGVDNQELLAKVNLSKDQYQSALTKAGLGVITTQVALGGEFYFAETYHQQYLSKNPNGYCGLSGCGVSFNAG